MKSNDFGSKVKENLKKTMNFVDFGPKNKIYLREIAVKYNRVSAENLTFSFPNH